MLSVDAITLTYIHGAHTPAYYLSILQCSVHNGADKGVPKIYTTARMEAHTGHAGRGLRPQGAQRRRGGTPPPALSGEASTATAKNPASAPQTLQAHPHQTRNPAQNHANRRSVDTENPRRPVANYSTAGVSRTLPAGASSTAANQPALGWRAGRGGTSYASRVGFT